MALNDLRKEFRQQMTGYVTAALGLVAGLAWNEAIKDTIAYIFPAKQDSLVAKYLYAVFVTLFVVLLTIYIVRLFREEEEQK